MKNTIKAGIGLSALAMTEITLAATSFDKHSQAAERNSTTTKQLDVLIMDWIGYLTGFLYLVALCIGLWWAYNILTAAGDEEKVKTGKSIILRAVLWLVAVFAINVIMKFVISALFSNA